MQYHSVRPPRRLSSRSGSIARFALGDLPRVELLDVPSMPCSISIVRFSISILTGVFWACILIDTP